MKYRKILYFLFIIINFNSEKNDTILDPDL